MSRVVIKVGSNVATDEQGALREDVLDSIVKQAVELQRAGNAVVMVTSGAISRGIEALGLSGRPSAMAELQAASAVGQGGVYSAYARRFRGHDVLTGQILLTANDFAARTSYVNARQTLQKLIEWGVVPVVNENDTTATDEITFGDNDFLAAQVAILVAADTLVLASDIDALHTADPHLQPDAERVGEVDDFGQLAALKIGDSVSAVGSGGMRAKVRAAEIATAGGIEVIVCGGARDGAIRDVVDGDTTQGTRFRARGEPQSSFKLWIRYAKDVAGRLVVDAGAERALKEQGTSLLPVGVTSVDGEFRAGDAVEIVAGERVIGKGITSCSSAELRRIKGLKSDEVHRLLPDVDDEAIHRDNLVLT